MTAESHHFDYHCCNDYALKAVVRVDAHVLQLHPKMGDYHLLTTIMSWLTLVSFDFSTSAVPSGVFEFLTHLQLNGTWLQ